MAEIKRSKWDLSEVFSGDLESEFGRLESLVAIFQTGRSDLTEDILPERFTEILEAYEEINTGFWILEKWAALKYAEDTRFSAIVANVDNFIAAQEGAIYFFDLWLMGLSQENFGRLVARVPSYQQALEKIRRYRETSLSEDAERAIKIKNATGFLALGGIREEITSRFTYLDKKGKRITQSDVTGLLCDDKGKVRAKTAKALYGNFEKKAPLLGRIFITRMRDWYNEKVILRGFSSPISAQNLINYVSDEASETVLATCREMAPSVFQRFFSLKKRLCKIGEEMTYADIYAPPRKVSHDEIGFSRNIEELIKSFASFSLQAAQWVREVFEKGHVHSLDTPYKSAESSCTGFPKGIFPYITSEFSDFLSEVGTPAHELGHLVQHLLSYQGQSVLKHDPSLPLSEVGSTFFEMLHTDRLMGMTEGNKVLKREILINQLDEAYQNLMNMPFFVIFEKEAFDRIMSPEAQQLKIFPISITDYLENNLEMF